jgi:hypothetical protein
VAVIVGRVPVELAAARDLILAAWYRDLVRKFELGTLTVCFTVPTVTVKVCPFGQVV